MKLAVIAASVLALAATPALAGGWGGHHQPASPQFAHASAMNYAVQAASIKAFISKGSIDQVTGASAEALNKAPCGCAGTQVATAKSKSVSLQVATIKSGVALGSISQSAVSTALAKNVRGGRH